MRGRLWPTVAALVAFAACSSDDKPPPLGGGASGGTSGSGTTPRSGSSGSEEGGNDPIGSGGADMPSGGAGDGPPIGEVGGQGLYDGGGAPANPATSCAPDAEWSPTPVDGVNTAADERLLAMTPDEATLVFSRDDELFVADDGKVSAVTLPSGYTHTLGVSLSPDGLSLVLTAEGGLGFAQVSRTERGVTFAGEPSTARFAYLNDARVTSGDLLSSPALSADGKTLYYTARKGASVAYVWRARGAQLSETKQQDPVLLGTDDGKAKLVVSVSADERTLFVLDEALGYVTGLWSVTPAAEFSGPVPFEGFETVFVNAACDRIYGTTRIGDSLDIVAGAAK